MPEFQEFPKAVYKLDDLRIVESAEQEADAADEGYGPYVCPTLRAPDAAPQETGTQSTPLQPSDASVGAAPRKPGRPRKAD